MTNNGMPDTFNEGFWWALDSGFLGMLTAGLLVLGILAGAFVFVMKRWGPKP